jgi:hypothetical protein
MLLCDPALILPPVEHPQNGADFWTRVIEWSADTRVRLGINSFDLVSAAYEELGWPIFEPPECPQPLKRTAGQSLNRLLSRVRSPTASDAKQRPTPTVSPRHRTGELVQEAIGRDAAELWNDDADDRDQDVMGLATAADHWEAQTTTITLAPPPPATLEIVLAPHVQTTAEAVNAAKEFFSGLRLTIYGGRKTEETLTVLEDRFGLSGSRLRWLEGEKGKAMKLDSLRSLRASVDIVVCVTGHIGHTEAETVRSRCKALSVAIVISERDTDIVAQLDRLRKN